MPTYEYVCDACGHKFDEIQSFSEAQLKKCPECKKNKLRRLFGSGAGIIFKGSGFYETDYRSDSYKSAANKESESAKPAADAAKHASTPAAGADKAATPAPAPAKESSPAKSSEKSPKSKK